VEVACQLAGDGSVDLHDAVDLIGRGCPVALAVEILL
jgi:hypothetical protein